MALHPSTPTEVYRVKHFGNIANNAFYNHLILTADANFESVTPETYTRHALSSPLWETYDFDPAKVGDLAAPIWPANAISVGSDEDKLGSPNEPGVIFVDPFEARANLPLSSPASLTLRWSRYIFRKLVRPALLFLKSVLIFFGVKPTTISRVWQNTGEVASYRFSRLLSNRSVVEKPGEDAITMEIDLPGRRTVDIIYGTRVRQSDSGSKLVFFEHGTVRWSEYSHDADVSQRRDYQRDLQAADFLLLSNLDSQSVLTARKLMNGRFAAFPHPLHLIDETAEFNYELNQELRDQLDSEFILIAPSSVNWRSTHDKGFDWILRAVSELRHKEGVRVGAVMTEWGADLEIAKEFLRMNNMDKFVRWIPPQPRSRLGAWAKAADFYLDQFALGAFGSGVIKAMNWGVPVISKALDPEGIELIGEPPPFIQIPSGEVLAQTLADEIRSMELLGREAYRERTGTLERSWVQRRHSVEITTRLQKIIFDSLFSGVEVKANLWALQEDSSQSTLI